MSHTHIDLPCVQYLNDVTGRSVILQHRKLAVRRDVCSRDHGPRCDVIQGAERVDLGQWLVSLPLDGSVEEDFCFTHSPVCLQSSVLLETEYGTVRCLPDVEYCLWKDAGLCQTSPVLLKLDDVTWRVIASENAVVEGEDVMPVGDDMNRVLYTYLKAYIQGGELLDGVKTAVARGDQDLHDHRDFLFKVYSLAGIPPTLSHDLTKTPLLNFCLGRCFHADDLEVVTSAVTWAECMALVKKLHLEVENHHPEHGARPAIVIRDMYLDRVSRGVQKSHGWRQEAWHIPPQYAPPEYAEDFSRLEKTYSHIQLIDPGVINVPSMLPGARLDLAWDELNNHN